jgi:peptidyl-prolyl cis-trans isomerase C
MQTITVNGVAIDHAAVAAETQHHPAGTPEEAAAKAASALVIRELLLQEAARFALQPDPQCDAKGRTETGPEALIRQLLEREVTVPEADAENCRRYYANNRRKFRSPDLFDAAHILFAAAPGDAAYDAAVEKAEQMIEVLKRDPGAFDAIAREHSDCTSRQNGGRLGQVARGETVPEFETFLCNLEEGQLCPVPVKSRYGAHVLRLDRKVAGRELPFENVADRIADYLHEASWRRAVAQYIQLLAADASIDGIDFGNGTPRRVIRSG